MTISNIKTLPINNSDIKEAVKLYKKSLEDNQKGFIQLDNHEETIRNMISEFRANNGDVYLLKKENKIVGIGALKKVNESTVEICKLHLYPHLKGFGLGKILALDLIEYAKDLGYTKINLHVTKTQKEAIGLYSRLGFNEYKQKLCTVNHNGSILKFDTLYMEKELETEELIEYA